MSKEWKNYIQWHDPTGREAIKRASRRLVSSVSGSGRDESCGRAKERLKSLGGGKRLRPQHEIDREIFLLRQQISAIKNSTEPSPYVSCAKLSDRLWGLRKERRRIKLSG